MRISLTGDGDKEIMGHRELVKWAPRWDGPERRVRVMSKVRVLLVVSCVATLAGTPRAEAG